MNDFQLIETMRWAPDTGIVRLRLHLARLRRSAARLGFPGADEAEGRLTNVLGVPPSALSGISPTKGEIAGDDSCPKTDPGLFSPPVGEMSARPTERGDAGTMAQTQSPLRVRLTLDNAGRIDITTAPFTPLPAGTVWTVRIAKTRLASTDPLLRYKTSRRAAYEAARAEYRTDEVDEVLLLNERDEPCEGTITSLFVDDGSGILKTPPISSGLLAGVLRTEMICKRKARVERLTLEDLQCAPVFIGNSLRGLIRAKLIWET
jgi:4-amino-4-deoxychorismate lyase